MKNRSTLLAIGGTLALTAGLLAPTTTAQASNPDPGHRYERYVPTVLCPNYDGERTIRLETDWEILTGRRHARPVRIHIDAPLSRAQEVRALTAFYVRGKKDVPYSPTPLWSPKSPLAHAEINLQGPNGVRTWAITRPWRAIAEQPGIQVVYLTWKTTRFGRSVRQQICTNRLPVALP